MTTKSHRRVTEKNHFYEDFKLFTLPFFFYYKADGCGEAGIWTVYNSQCYQCINDTVSWQTARSSCQQLGADLVTINNAGTQNFTESVIFFIS